MHTTKCSAHNVAPGFGAIFSGSQFSDDSIFILHTCDISESVEMQWRTWAQTFHPKVSLLQLGTIIVNEMFLYDASAVIFKLQMSIYHIYISLHIWLVG